VICKAATFDFAIAVGKLVVDTFYSGDLSRWRARDPHKDASLRKLITHRDLPMSGSALYRSLAIYEISERLQIRSWQHVSTSHIRLVLPLRSDEQGRLLKMSEANRWSVRRLDEEVVGLLRADPAARTSRGGRKRGSHLREAMRIIEQSIDAVEKAMLRDDNGDLTMDPSPDSTREAILLLRSAAHAFSILERRLTNALALPPESADPGSREKYREATQSVGEPADSTARGYESDVWPIEPKSDPESE
jgi:hypothetical protein